MKRYYLPNKDIEVNGHRLTVTTGGTVYLNETGTLLKLDSLWMERLHQLCVSLPDGGMVRLKPSHGEMKVITRGLGIYV
jgi:hypothetical protein